MACWDDSMDLAARTSYPTTTTTDFDQYYLTYPLSNIAKDHLETGNKIIMPQSALEQLITLGGVIYPMVFRIESTLTGDHTHCGVIEFTADEGIVFLPTWMMNNMKLQPSDIVNIKNTWLPKATYIKIQPHATKFTTLSDHKSLLENTFRNFACLTKGDTIVVNHGEDKFMIDILETKPSPAVSMSNTDCEVDFAPPLDYKEPEKKTTNALKRKSSDEEDRSSGDDDTKVLFPGIGRRLDGKQVLSDDKCCLTVNQSLKKLKRTESTKLVDGKLKTIKERTEARPFVGVSKRVDGQPAGVVTAAKEEVKHDQSNAAQVNMKGKEVGFKAFTGKSYRLG